MASQIVRMEATKMLKLAVSNPPLVQNLRDIAQHTHVPIRFQIIDHAIQNPSFRVKTDDAYQNCGCAISITIAATIPTSRLTCAGSVTVPTAGNAVLVGRTIGVYRNGCSAMARTIVATDRTNCPKIAPNATKPATSSVRIIAVYQGTFYSS